MSFLDRAKAKVEEKEVTKKPERPNPFARKNPFAKKKAKVEEKVEEKIEEEVKEKTEEPKETAKKEPKQEETKTKKDDSKPKEKAEKETPKKEEAPKETKEPAKEVKKETKKEAQAESKNNKTKKEPKKQQNTKKEDSTVSQDDFYEIPRTEMPYGQAVSAVRPKLTDDKWDEFKEEIISDLNKVTIASDLNPGMLKVVVEELSIIRDKIWLPLNQAKTELDYYAPKGAEGIIDQVKRVNAKGNNETERRRSGTVACMNFKTDEGMVNLFDVLHETRERYNFLDSAMKSVDYKTRILITMNGALKLEQDLIH